MIFADFFVNYPGKPDRPKPTLNMEIREIMELTAADCLCGNKDAPLEIRYGFAADLMSDVLKVDTTQLLLVTGLCNIQTIRTAEMSDLRCILFVRGKKATPEMVALAEQNGIVLLESAYSMFRAVGQLARAGIEPIF